MPIDNRVKVVQAALALARDVNAQSGRANPDDVAALAAAVGNIDAVSDPAGAAAANAILNAVQFDNKIDDYEVPIIQSNAAALIAESGSVSTAAAALKSALRTGSVNKPTLIPTSVGINVDLRKVADPTVNSFDACCHLKFGKDVPAQGTLAVDPSRLAIKDVKVQGQSVPFTVKDGMLSYATRGSQAVDIDYSLTPQYVVSNDDFGGGTGLIVDRRDPKNVQVSSLLWPYNTDQLFPSNPDPQYGVSAKVTVQSPQGFVTHSTDEDKSVPSYDIAIRSSNNLKEISGPSTASGTKLNMWTYANGALAPDGDYQTALQDTAKGLDEVSRILQTPYPDKEINFQETAGGGGGMEHQGMPFIYDGAITDPSKVGKGINYDPLHEAIHGFFGNGVRIGNWANFTVSEGFVDYLTHRGDQAALGKGAFYAELDEAKANLARAEARDPAALVTPPQGDINQWFTTVPYDMGTWLLRMCETSLGTDKFDNLLSQFYKAHDRQSANLSDWTQFLTDKTGKDFNEFYKKWGTVTGVPTYESSWKANGNSVDLSFMGLAERIPSDANNPLLTGQVPVLLQGANGESKTVMVAPDSGDYSSGARLTTVDAGFPVTKVTYDPDRTVLANFEAPTADRVGEQDTGSVANVD